jgi:hypothetical protein
VTTADRKASAPKQKNALAAAASMAAFSPASPTVFQDRAGTPLSRFSPDYPDSEPHGGFDPNAFFSPSTTGLNNPYNPSSVMRRGPLPFSPALHHQTFAGGYQDGVASQDAHNVFGGMTDDDSIMHELIQDGTQAAAADTQAADT